MINNNFLNNKGNTFGTKQPQGLNNYTNQLEQISNLAIETDFVIISRGLS
jgi:hypothetical protein